MLSPKCLTARERKMVRMLCDGMRQREIARELRMDYKQLKRAMSGIYRKWGIGSQHELVACALLGPGHPLRPEARISS